MLWHAVSVQYEQHLAGRLTDVLCETGALNLPPLHRTYIVRIDRRPPVANAPLLDLGARSMWARGKGLPAS